MKHMKIDLHPIAKDGKRIDEALRQGIREAHEKKVKKLEIVHGKGSGQLKQKEFRTLYQRVEKDRDNSGRLFVHFKH
jgi:DNA-nicking Smr family endonuclease